ncbi:hypothetical protein CP97_01400 [Aurantiacibacter atlanticus]|uniref:Polysaccharide pyruvyl transferase domain-containing protein n=1 Tax=Aurantiacibacter atlanticus TaxID=1648404 RepID=A0A0H4V8Q7_9SPHN|nr:hypothetical protein CP97_01400 [Aurantiacibacter atlanticus]
MKIGLVGTFDVDNYGDCLFPELYAHEIAKRIPGARFTLYSPFARAARILSFDTVLALPATLDAASFDEDVLVLTGGETLSSGHNSGTYIVPLSTLSHYLRLWLVPTMAATTSTTKFIAHSVGVRNGPADNSLVARLLESADRISLRDASSHSRLDEKFTVDVDPVFLLPDMLSQDDWTRRCAGLLPDGLECGSYIAVQATNSYFAAELDEWCDEVAKVLKATGKKALMVPVCHFLEDYRFLEIAGARLAARYPELADTLYFLPQDRQNVMDTAALIARSAGYIGTSLHGAVTAAAFALPMSVYSGHGKKNGKHYQTLLAAGIDDGVFHSLDDLADCFAASGASDLVARSKVAQDRARKSVEILSEAILAPKETRPPLDPADISAICQADRTTVSTCKERVKRRVFSLLRSFPTLYEGYRSIRLRHQFANVADANPSDRRN